MVPYLRAANIRDGELLLDDIKFMNFSPEEQAVFGLRPGDVLVTEGAGSLTAVGASAVWDGSIEGPLCFQNTLLRLRPREPNDARFLGWWARAAHGSGQFAAIAGGANIFHLGAEAVRAMRAPIPSVEQQRRIADFLDAETARIDALIAAKQQMREVLTTRLWVEAASLFAAQDSVTAPLRRVLKRISDGPFGSALRSEHYTPSGIRVVRLGNIGLAEFLDGDRAFIDHDRVDELRRHAVTAGTLLIAGLGDQSNHVGRAAVAPDGIEPAIVKADCYAAIVDDSRSLPEYLAWYLSCPLGRDAVALASRGTTRTRINLDIAKNISVPVPPLNTQRRTVEALNQLRSRASVACARLTRQIELLRERRQALITAAVTGELEV